MWLNIVSQRKTFLSLLFPAFSSAEILEGHSNDYFKINSKQIIKMPKKVEIVTFKSFAWKNRKIKSPFVVYADFESILVPDVIVKEHPGRSKMTKYQSIILCSYGCELVCIDDQFRKPFKSCLGEGPV